MSVKARIGSAIFLGSALLFCIQPMMGRTLQPLFGGSAAVWSVCLATYQVLLLAGYGYAHWLIQRAGRIGAPGRPSDRNSRRLHLGLLAVSAVWILGFALLRGALKGGLSDAIPPALQVLLCVALGVGLPYVLLSSGSTLVQAWLAGAGTSGDAPPSERRESPQVGAEPEAVCQSKRDVYRLYALSNLGSIFGLLVYPLALEPFVSLQAQWYGFTACLAGYAALMVVVAKATGTDHTSETMSSDGQQPPRDPQPVTAPLPPSLARPWLWYLLPGLATFVLNAVTAYLSADVMPMPMLWVLLLGAFLLSFVAGFSRPGEVALPLWCMACAASAVFLLYAYWKGATTAFLLNMGAGSAFIFFSGLFLTGWLYRIRPDARRLSHFYLGVAAGGAIGGVAASLVCPFLFSHVAELPLALLALPLLCAAFLKVLDHKELRGGLNTALILICLVAAVVTATVWKQKRIRVAGSWRNFYSVTVAETEPILRKATGEKVGVEHRMFHGGTVHGVQSYCEDFEKRPTTYFGPVGGGAAIRNHPRYLSGEPLRVGVLGLGIGTLAAWGRPGDLYRFYEINPQVIDLARNTNFFTYVSDCKAHMEIVLGDARKSLEAERGRKEALYDVLFLDAFSGDNLPIHLISREAFDLYLSRLKPDGILAINATNWHIDLLPLCKAVALYFKLQPTGIAARGNPDLRTLDSMWVLLCRGKAVKPDLSPSPAALIDWAQVPVMRRPITDDRGCVLGLIKFGMAPPVLRVEE